MPQVKPKKIPINPCRHCHENEQFKYGLCSTCSCAHCKRILPVGESNLCEHCYNLPIEKHIDCITCLCLHCNKRARFQANLCAICCKIPKCKGCTIIMGYYNEPHQKIEYNAFNQITNPSTGRCVGCEALINH